MILFIIVYNEGSGLYKTLNGPVSPVLVLSLSGWYPLILLRYKLPTLLYRRHLFGRLLNPTYV